ncbi:MAG: hypothetical protein J0M36_12405 [Caulobacterales bacterium]|nr:hypothetical protein [Caulobacterales bacterium]
MRASVLVSVLALALATGTSAMAQATPEGLAWMVLRDINDYGFDRDDPTNRPPLVVQVPAGAIRAVDVTHDGRSDWRIDYEAVGISGFCGTGGCSQIVYVSLGDDGLTRAFDNQAHGLTFYEADGESRIEAWVHHSYCSSDASRDCKLAYAWDPALKRLVERPNRAGEAVVPVGGFSPIDASADRGPNPNAPEAVADIWFKTRTTCASVYVDDGFEVRRAAIHDTPDVDGDGRRDWAVERPAPCQASPGDPSPYPGFEIWLSRDEGQAVQAYVSPPERFPNLDVSRAPAVVVIQSECGLDQVCPTTRLRWDPASGRLIE